MGDNRVYLGDDGIVRMVLVGEQDGATSSAEAEEVLRLISMSHGRKLLFDTTRAGRFSVEARKGEVRCLAIPDKIAIVASSMPMRALGLFMVAEAKARQAKLFDTPAAALDWLTEAAKHDRWSATISHLWRAILGVRWLRIKERWLNDVFEVLRSVALGDLSKRIQVSQHDDELALIEAGINLMADDLEDREKEAREYQTRLRGERSRFARDLHDSISQLLFSVVLNSEAAGTLVQTDPQLATTHIESVRLAAGEAQKQMRQLLSESSVGAVDGGLATAIRTYLNDFTEREGIEATLSIEGERRKGTSMERELFRIAQEALNNVAKHSQATSASVSLTFNAGQVRLNVEDDGIGFDTRRYNAGLGLKNMRERAEGLGGQLAVESAPGNGTRVTVQVPLKERNGQDQHTDSG